MRVNLGSGTSLKHGYINVDTLEIDNNVSREFSFVRSDAREYVRSLRQSSVEEFYSRHFFEHLEFSEAVELIELMRDRLHIGGRIVIVVPHWSNPYYWSDPTHKSTYGLYSFEYFSGGRFFRRKVPSYSKLEGLTTIGVKIRFRSMFSGYVGVYIAKLLEAIANSSKKMQELWEYNLASVLRVYEIEYLIEKTGESKSC